MVRRMDGWVDGRMGWSVGVRGWACGLVGKWVDGQGRGKEWVCVCGMGIRVWVG